MPRSKLVQILKATYTGALIIRNGFWGPLYYTYNTEPPKIVLVIVKAPFFSPMHPHLLENTDPGRLTLVERVSILMEISDRGVHRDTPARAVLHKAGSRPGARFGGGFGGLRV